MNRELAAYARKQIKEGLALLPAENQLFFKRMYSHKELDKPIDDVVDAMPDDKLVLCWAMSQVANTIAKLPKDAPT
jgi:hypothetical protein